MPDFPARTSQLPEKAQGSQDRGADFSGLDSRQQTLFSEMEAGSSSRMWETCSVPKVAEISPSFSRRYKSGGFWTEPGECSTLSISEWPSAGAEYSCLRAVLEADVHPRFYLSQKAAAGILRRAHKRRKKIPEELLSALQQVCGDLIETTRPPYKPQQVTTQWLMDSQCSTEIKALAENQRAEMREMETTPALTKGGGKMGQGYQAIREGQVVRRLTPTECERLQGFPDGWTVI